MVHRVIGAVVLLASLTIGWLWMDFAETVDSPLPISSPVRIAVPKGTSLGGVIALAVQAGLTEKPHWFRVLASIDGVARKLRYGAYEIPVGMTPRGFFQLLSSGSTVRHEVTLIEGWTFAQIAERLALAPGCVHEPAGLTPEAVMSALGVPGRSPEGRFYPDTYFCEQGNSELDILRTAYRRMDQVLRREWSLRAPDVAVQTPDEALTLASIIEKETGQAAERPLIGGVFSRRLRIGMPLQSDPTVIYGMGSSFAGNLTRSDLSRPNPYNTYKVVGLPPTPIAMPGLAALQAALHPDGGRALYFVAKGNGEHVFSESLLEHNHAVSVFQKRSR